MSGYVEATGVSSIHRKLRLVGILSAAESAGLTPMPTRQLHAVGYFADALAPVWGLRILDAQVLKLRDGPTSPLLQGDLDRLVGVGVVIVSSVRHVENAEGLWGLDADYSLHPEFSQPILDQARSFDRYLTELDFLREVVFALSGMGALGIVSAGYSDASYGDEMISAGGMVDIAGRESEPNPTAKVAIRFGQLLQPEIELSSAEMIHLYVRELYNRLRSR